MSLKGINIKKKHLKNTDTLYFFKWGHIYMYIQVPCVKSYTYVFLNCIDICEPLPTHCVTVANAAFSCMQMCSYISRLFGGQQNTIICWDSILWWHFNLLIFVFDKMFISVLGLSGRFIFWSVYVPLTFQLDTSCRLCLINRELRG